MQSCGSLECDAVSVGSGGRIGERARHVRRGSHLLQLSSVQFIFICADTLHAMRSDIPIRSLQISL